MTMALVRLHAREMDEKLPTFCRKKVHSTARKHVAQYNVDTAHGGQAVHILAAVMMIDMNGPDIEVLNGRSEGANSGICPCLEELQEEIAVNPGAVKGPVLPEAPTRPGKF